MLDVFTQLLRYGQDVKQGRKIKRISNPFVQHE